MERMSGDKKTGAQHILCSRIGKDMHSKQHHFSINTPEVYLCSTLAIKV
jgi:hypothetical protein